MKWIAWVFAWFLLSAALLRAETALVTLNGSCATNATAVAQDTNQVRGLLYRAVIACSSGKTCDVSLVDIDGTTILSTNGVSSITLSPTPAAATALILKTANANTTNGTISVKCTIFR